MGINNAYKLSRYTVFSEPVHQGAYQILYSTRTARTVLLRSEVAKQLQSGMLQELTDATRTQLLDNEVLVPQTENELETILGRNIKAADDTDTLYYVIQPTAACQLGCGYCGQQHTKDALKEDMYSAILERIITKLKNNPEYTKVHVGWFGAEPLMGLRHMKTLTAFIRGIAEDFGCTYSASIVTNGMSLKKNIFITLAELGINDIDITLDGTAEYHDQRRHLKNGGKSFEIIFNHLLSIFNMPNYKDYGVEISIRCNVDNDNYQGVADLIDLLASHNFQSKIGSFYVAPIHSWGNDAHLQALEKDNMGDLEINLMIQLYKLNFPFSLIPNETQPVVCMVVQKDAELVDAHGNVFNCTEIPYVPIYEESDYKLGNLKFGADTISDRRPLSNWNDDIRNAKFPCHGCRILPICGGACPKSWHEGNSPCPSIKFNIEDRLLIWYMRHFVDKGTESREAILN